MCRHGAVGAALALGALVMVCTIGHGVNAALVEEYKKGEQRHGTGGRRGWGKQRKSTRSHAPAVFCPATTAHQPLGVPPPAPPPPTTVTLAWHTTTH